MVRFKYVNKETGAVTMLENQKEALDFVAKSKDVTEGMQAKCIRTVHQFDLIQPQQPQCQVKSQSQS